jgi:hypothetical protein
MIEFNAKDLAVGDEFTTQESQGETWFRAVTVEKVDWLLNVHGVVVSSNPDGPYAVGESEWFDFAADTKVIVR